ncbi:phosphoribosyltransferase family protein [Rodentibacter sp. Ppn85]|uniref:phosphoribosyltransferase family protein n=1 Tax=Rodentibacter sp. Ppn85 TaxID=1908525 RepID=UPI0009864545|nr:phosphoribosyltransferase family protein [Rodentibacter sp. Ppn85]OOF65671.1 amidophosphoribosyltransferase [Rodentibacter sp. Ppn85]
MRLDFSAFFQFNCVLCQSSLKQGQNGLCSTCQRQIQQYIYCGGCGAPLQYFSRYCGRCGNNEFAWDRMVIVGHYDESLSRLIHRFKYQKQFWLDRTLARLLLLSVYEARRNHGLTFPQAIIPVPLYHLRQWQRGYNQADLLAKTISRWLEIPCISHIVKRVKHTHTQRGLSAAIRRQNLKNAFKIDLSKPFPYQRVALVDDVITTGSTLNEIAKLLRGLGVQEIQVWGLARA